MVPLWWAGEALDDRAGPIRDKAKSAQANTKNRLELLKSPVILLLFLFFAFISLASNGLQAFTVISLNLLHGYSHNTGIWALSAYLFSGGAGVLLGGWLADRIKNHELATAISYAASAVVVLIAALIKMPEAMMIALFAVGGFLASIVSPIRDLIVRQKSPPGAIGTVYAIVTLGFSVGIGSLPVFGWFNDIGVPHLLFWCNAALLAGAVVSVYAVRNARA
jgi:predicted MFS family arabinose efflux permease